MFQKFYVLNLEMAALDIGSGTAHIIQELALDNESSLFIGLDLSTAMLKVANENTPNSFQYWLN